MRIAHPYTPYRGRLGVISQPDQSALRSAAISSYSTAVEQYFADERNTIPAPEFWQKTMGSKKWLLVRRDHAARFIDYARSKIDADLDAVPNLNAKRVTNGASVNRLKEGSSSYGVGQDITGPWDMFLSLFGVDPTSGVTDAQTDVDWLVSQTHDNDLSVMFATWLNIGAEAERGNVPELAAEGATVEDWKAGKGLGPTIPDWAGIAMLGGIGLGVLILLTALGTLSKD